MHILDRRAGNAFHNIQWGISPWMLAGGGDAPIAPLIVRGFTMMGTRFTPHR
jgi:3-oxoacyl-(acyl-carrier-protein) synthase